MFGTLALLGADEQALGHALLINKFRGDASLLDSGLASLTERTGVRVLGVLPHVFGLSVDEEDVVILKAEGRVGRLGAVDIGVIHLPHISTATDSQPLNAEPDVTVRYVESAADFGEPDLLILPGTKSTAADYAMRPKDFDQFADWLQDSIDVRLLESIIGLPLHPQRNVS